jgi:hypothetical protein
MLTLLVIFGKLRRTFEISNKEILLKLYMKMLVPAPLNRSEYWIFVTKPHERRTERTDVNFFWSVVG